MKPVTWIAVVVFVLAGMVHLVWLVLGVPVTVGAAQIPAWVSGVAVLVSLGMAGLLVREGCATCTRDRARDQTQRRAPR